MRSNRSINRYLMSGLRELVRPGIGVHVSRSHVFSGPSGWIRPWVARIWEPGKMVDRVEICSRDWNELLWSSLEALIDFKKRDWIRGKRKRPSWMEKEYQKIQAARQAIDKANWDLRVIGVSLVHQGKDGLRCIDPLSQEGQETLAKFKD